MVIHLVPAWQPNSRNLPAPIRSGRRFPEAMPATISRRLEAAIPPAIHDPAPGGIILRFPAMRTTSGSLFGLAPDGVYQPPASQPGLVVSYTTLSPFPTYAKASVGRPKIRTQAGRSFSAGRWFPFCCTVHILTDPPRYGASCPAVLGLSSSSRRGGKTQPSDRLIFNCQ